MVSVWARGCCQFGDNGILETWAKWVPLGSGNGPGWETKIYPIKLGLNSSGVQCSIAIFVSICSTMRGRYLETHDINWSLRHNTIDYKEKIKIVKGF